MDIGQSQLQFVKVRVRTSVLELPKKTHKGKKQKKGEQKTEPSCWFHMNHFLNCSFQECPECHFHWSSSSRDLVTIRGILPHLASEALSKERWDIEEGCSHTRYDVTHCILYIVFSILNYILWYSKVLWAIQPWDTSAALPRPSNFTHSLQSRSNCGDTMASLQLVPNCCGRQKSFLQCAQRHHCSAPWECSPCCKDSSLQGLWQVLLEHSFSACWLQSKASWFHSQLAPRE